MAHVRADAPPRRDSARLVLGVLFAGTAVAVTLGALGSTVGQPRSLSTFGFSSMQTFKAWLATLVLVLVLLQVTTALWIYGRLPGLGSAPRAVHPIHRASGVAAIVLTLPIAWYCLYAFGFDTSTTRTTAHSVLGCLFYGVFVAKMAALRVRRIPPIVVPILGGLLFAVFVATWWLSALWWFNAVGWTR
ncbi:uncharacterized protein (DUF697 family) [Marmoricola sp. URHA0025 HA25]